MFSHSVSYTSTCSCTCGVEEERRCRARYLVSQLMSGAEGKFLAPLFFQELVRRIELRHDLYFLIEPLLAAVLEHAEVTHV